MTNRTQGGIAATALAQFLASGSGRLLRVAAGVVLIAVGLLVVGGAAGFVLALVGFIPLAAGTFDFCVLTRLLGGPLGGRAVRACAR